MHNRLCNVCGEVPCVCIKPPGALVFQPAQLLPPGITKEAFGVNLYQAITLAGGVMQLRQYVSKAEDRQQRQEYCDREKKLLEQMHTAMQLLTAEELVAFTDKYPWSLK